ncbi:MAG: IS110 family transposase [Candidatus Eremiobacteraeota bacterium]|nr:IS110 family transposase [Candidatus Eremiobacteraeota bacterium]
MRSIVYVGMDVHKDTVSVAILRDNNMHVEYERTLRNEPGQMKKFFKRLKEKEESILSCYEAGPTGFTLYRMLEEMEITCYVAAPTLIPRKPGDQIKTDRRDAKTLAKVLRNQEIVSVYVPTKTDESVRDYLRMYHDMRSDLKRQKQRLLQFLLRIGKKYDTGKSYWTGAHKKWLKSLQFAEAAHKDVFNEYYTVISEMEEKIVRLKEKTEELSAEARYAEKVSKLRCFKGVDTLTALSFVVEIGDFRRFRKAEEFMAYLGLVPSEHSSGGKRRLGSITKAGNSQLRKLLVESSWHYRLYGPSKRLAMRRKGQPVETIAYADKAGRRLNKKYTRLMFRGKIPQKTVVAVARELSGFIWGMMVGNTSAA